MVLNVAIEVCRVCVHVQRRRSGAGGSETSQRTDLASALSANWVHLFLFAKQLSVQPESVPTYGHCIDSRPEKYILKP
jgi:hypothetical protein